MKIRALTIFVTELNREKIEAYSNYLTEIKDERIWTRRISLPPLPKDFPIDKVIDLIPDGNDVIYSAIHLTSKDNRIRYIPELLSTKRNIYSSVLLRREEDIDELSKLIYSLEPNIATRFAILINEDFLVTPYFPVGSANTIVDSLAVSLLYVNDYMGGNAGKALSNANEIAKEYSKKLKLRYLGVDISLSPWKDESVANVIENKSGKIFSPGNTYTVHEINKDIFQLSWKLKITPIGFSEIMLPVAEDEVLMKRVEEGSLTLSQLQNLTFACVAGLDMVAIPRDTEIYRKILLDSFAIQFVKKRPYGVRIIPSNGSGYIFLNDYGKIPEIKIS